MRRLAVVLGPVVGPVLVSGLVSGLSTVVAAGPAAAANRLAVERGAPPAVTGFALGSLRPALVHRDAHALTTVTVAGIGVTPAGDGVATPSAAMLRVADAARADGLRVELLLSNYSDDLGDFDPRAAHQLLASPDHVAAVADAVAAHATDGGWDGVNVDLERVRAADAGGLVDLVTALQQALPDEASVSIDISAATSVRGYRQRGYALAGLAAAADVVAVMAYDQHGPTWSGPGPIGGLGWQRDSLEAVLEKVPADRVDLGVAGYGYSWPRRGTGRTYSDAGARKAVARAGARPTWHPRAGEWSARLPGGTVLWWSDGRSYRHRVALARELGVHGLAVWRLGSADPL